MLLKELIRFSTQHRTLYCYMILSIWIFLLIAGMYKYIGYNVENNLINGGKSPIQNSYADTTLAEDDETSKILKFKERCMPMQRLIRQDDGGLLEGWKLQGVLLVIRHGDRGPMSHVRAVSDIDCGIVGDNLLNRYRSFLHNSSNSASGANHLYWQKLGAFHGFALLPATEKYCLLGQLTYKGVAQLLHVGELLHQIYANPLGLWKRQTTNGRSADVTPHSLLNSDEVVLYTTRYRRTFQSALALLYAFLPADKWLALNVRESHSMAFCFTDCACPQAEVLRKRLATLSSKALMQQPHVLNVLQLLGSTLLQYTTSSSGINEPNEVVDAMLTILCHDGTLPCRRWFLHNVTSGLISAGTTISTTTQSVLDLSDVINIDQDDTAANLLDPHLATQQQSNEFLSLPAHMQGVSSAACQDASQHVRTLLSYASAQSAREAAHIHYKHTGLLKAYGLVRHIVSHMLKMISGDRSKFVLYSGHDFTLQYLTAALGIRMSNTFIPYASRLAFELYRSEMHTDYYFRIIYNGRDVTQEVDFCEGGKSLRVTRDSRGNKADLCPIENIIRFLHEDYFSSLNTTNFKEACAIMPRPGEF